MTRSFGIAVALLVVAVFSTAVCLVFTYAALKEGSWQFCAEQTTPPDDAVFVGEAAQMNQTLTVVPLVLWCEYSTADATTVLRPAYIASPFEFVAIGSLLGSLVVAIRSRRDSVQVLLGFLLLAVGVVGGVFSVSAVAVSIWKTDPNTPVLGVIAVLCAAAVALGVLLLARWFAKYARSASQEASGIRGGAVTNEGKS